MSEVVAIWFWGWMAGMLWLVSVDIVKKRVPPPTIWLAFNRAVATVGVAAVWPALIVVGVIKEMRER